ncbi:NUDIX hydrolase [Peloplasma aerotolerans]|uniref:NUDIX hydrolase n=1 Tax=Peloplasma aerotolerans TaxID=3044389 RepID=A0AAW6U663_9MOLU|nr:NUDIX hydrolase [Mariniplasma sp. M4Ah]MDI6453392.1 NUDIX hydrolase [Mariniplasma sp. M4Ah]MDR4969245.1 NUDIX hydrolase [Acholeplasmataceae bacterium]
MYKKLFAEYQPKNEQESKDLQLILNFIKRNDDALYRTNLAGHITSSAFVLNQKMTKILFAYHHIYDSWAWVGGHNDGNPNLLEVAIKEAKEETGVKHVVPYSDQIFTVDVIYVKNHIKNGLYVPDHLHLNATFLLIADENDPLLINHAENSGVKWFLISEVIDYVSEARMKPVYLKAFHEIEKIRKQQK